ncbi:M28 family metallopeptidase [Oceanirhabdus seepicola]|uniref:Zn-dependent exopeptidase M28 n=1 Tax=Oceanirhabdus seepicola TaxID=2828781 RepID=A0A9J6P5U6_9CLOT|nr:M28 family metallopeptidase [Oceanirhabdus seepicola]MCM1991971.1 Zn-dependent exopeptidase M28 [Oceanirhabdus seepicola]
MLGKKSKILCIVSSVLLTTSLFMGCNKSIVNGKVNNDKIIVGDKEQNSEYAKEVFENLNEDIDGDLMISTIKELASEKFDGRLTGTEGNKLATEYIRSEFEELGLETLEGMDGYLQYYDQMVPYLKDIPKINIVNKDGETVKELKFLEDFVVRANPDFKIKGTVKGETIYLKNKSEFKKNKENLEGKIAIIPKNLFWESDVQDFFISGKSKALGIIRENTFRNGEDKSFKKSVYFTEGNYESRNEDIPMLADVDIAGTNILIEEGKKGNLVELNFECYVEEKTIANVIGVIPGTDEEMKDDYIIISGHFDHLGNNYDGTYNPGASDNASGIASMLEIARSIKSNNIAPKRPILFIAFNGEENGLNGSKFFAENSGLDMKKVTMLNIDMIANKSDGPLYIAAVGYTELFKEIVEIAKEMDISYKQNLQVTYSDHTYIEEEGGQAVTLVEIEQAEYHTPDDTIEVIEKADLEEVIELVLRYISDKAF